VLAAFQLAGAGDHRQPLAVADAHGPAARGLDDDDGIGLGQDRNSGGRHGVQVARPAIDTRLQNQHLSAQRPAFKSMPMTTGRSVVEAIGGHPADPPEPRQRGHWLRDLGQGRVHESRPVGQGSGALYIIRDAEKRGLLERAARSWKARRAIPASGLAMVGSALGYRTVIVIPRTQSQEKKDAIRLLAPSWWRWTPCPTQIRAIM